MAQIAEDLLLLLLDNAANRPALDRDRREKVLGAAVLLHPVNGLGALLSLNERGWRWVHSRAGDIAGGCWVDESSAELPHVNLAVTMSAVRPALT